MTRPELHAQVLASGEVAIVDPFTEVRYRVRPPVILLFGDTNGIADAAGVVDDCVIAVMLNADPDQWFHYRGPMTPDIRRTVLGLDGEGLPRALWQLVPGRGLVRVGVG